MMMASSDSGLQVTCFPTYCLATSSSFHLRQFVQLWRESKAHSLPDLITDSRLPKAIMTVKRPTFLAALLLSRLIVVVYLFSGHS